MILYLLPFATYLLGSLSSAIIIARLAGLQDPRNVGSGNPGATNILRYGGKKLAVLTLVGDILKGVIAVLVARLLTDNSWIVAASGLAAFLGHLYPLYFGFKGGKGVATAWGVLVSLNVVVGLALAVTWLLIAVIFRYSSLAAITAAVLTPIYMWYWHNQLPAVLMALIMAAILLWRHRGNIERLLDGRETKIGSKQS